MPKSKRNVTISLTKVKKHNKKEAKNIRLAELNNFLAIPNIHIYVLDLRTYSNNNLKHAIEHFKAGGGKFFIGKNKLMQLALNGAIIEQKAASNLEKISELLVGNRVLLLTKDKPLSVIKFFNEFQPEEYIKPGNVSTVNVVLKCGKELNVPVSMQKDLQQRKVNFEISDQKIILIEDKVLATKDKIITPENAQILRMLNMKIAYFDITVLAYWHKRQFVSLMST
ncbi:ribosome biogenesis protein MRT4, putative [Hepatocystis sp. ex Piliocolobus tephrosceles]|uniref:Uncharacterized LOC113221424 n=1 Tax=Piliocolobus tephrosceles TaxID=591936 RepID=A0A8C9H6A4_9PRIM|nr:ribosome biogenesis protein MRT4, putative [Hepatocystis sp. ex Piliocolobus tephrosceles]